MDAVSPEPAAAQGGGATTSLSGTVTDTSGAIIPGASVVVKNIATSTQFDAVTNESGYFSVPALDPGTYTVTVTLMGFKTAVLNDVRVNASTPATVKVALAVGGLEETVVVTGGAEIIQTTSAAVTSTIDTNQILKIPTGSRSALEFVALLPGVSTPGGPGGSRDSTVNGLPQSAINITIDGMSAQDNHLKTGDGFFARVSPRLDAIEEVTVNSAAQDASSTGQGAVQIRFVTRSGSNQFTGSGYYYLQHYKLNANTWFNNRDNAPKSDDVLHQPGGRIGGPIIDPGHLRTAATRRSSSSTTKSRARRERTPRIERCCTRAPNRAGSATPPAARRAKSTCWRSRPRTAWCRRSIRRSAGCSATSAPPRPAARSSTTPTR